jgi:superfamily II DNA or RNA helicase
MGVLRMNKFDNLLAECASWDDFWERANALPTTKDKGTLFERLTQVYLLTQPEYQSRLKNVWNAAVDLPDKVRTKLNLPPTDEGIDLIAETRDGEFWAIQCKFRKNTTKALTRKELSTFTSLAFATCKNIALGVVAHTCSKPVRKQELLGNTVEIGLDRWLEIDEDGWKRIQAQAEGRPELPKKRRPRPHQKEAIKASKKHFRSKKVKRGRMIMPCGTGKSLTAFWVALALKDVNTILVAVPSLALIKQSLADWTREYLAHGLVPEWLCVCSDETVGNLSQDEFMSGTYDLGIDTTTDAKKIAKFLKKKSDSPKIVFATYQSGIKLGEGARKAECEFDLAILDEAHKTVGKKAKLFASLLFDKNVPIKRRMFMTATERVVQARSEEVLSMDDEAVYGERFYHLSFKEAIEASPPIISNYKVVTIAVTDERLAELIANNELILPEGTGLEEQEAQSLAAGVALRETFKERGIKHAISFHRSIKAASGFADQQNTLSSIKGIAPNIEAVHVSSKRSAGERAALMKQFKETEHGLVTNARCLTEGVDVPSVDCVMFADPKNSVVDIVQAAGRALRIYPGKDYGYIMLPVVVPKGMDFDEFMETTPFKKVAQVITALSTQDDRIAEQFRESRSDRDPEDRIVEFEVDVSVGTKINIDALYDKIDARVWEKVGKANWRPFEEAREYARGLGLKDNTAWSKLSKAGKLPSDIPAGPYHTYNKKGWAGFRDWLGTEWRPFAEAREYARALNLKSGESWGLYNKMGNLPSDIPSAPARVYSDEGWRGWGDWLGTGNVKPGSKHLLPFEEAQKYACSLGIKNKKEWREFTRSGELPSNIPATPEHSYRDEGWSSYGNWLGTDNVAGFLRTYRSFEDARKYVRSLGLRNQRDWSAFTNSGKLPSDIPATPQGTYRNKGWKSLGDWLGTGNVAPSLMTFRSFEQAREYARSLKLKTGKEWGQLARSGELPNDIAKNPDQKYRDNGWLGWGDWLGTGAIATQFRSYRSFEEARKYARSLNLKSGAEWRRWVQSDDFPADIPVSPRSKYLDEGWLGMDDWLGTGKISIKDRYFRSFEQAREYARSLKLKTGKEWGQLARSGELPNDIAKNPDRKYRDNGWLGWGDWLGTGNVANTKRSYRSFEEARKFARSLRLANTREWKEFSKSDERPDDIPGSPSQTYCDQGWKGFGDWLGSDNIANANKAYISFKKARYFARNLALKSSMEWTEFARSGGLRTDIPRSPPSYYKEKGWAGWGDWLGTGSVAPKDKSYRSFEEAREYARSLNLKSVAEWLTFGRAGKLPPDIPLHPGPKYKTQGWSGYRDWLGTKKQQKKKKPRP